MYPVNNVDVKYGLKHIGKKSVPCAYEGCLFHNHQLHSICNAKWFSLNIFRLFRLFCMLLLNYGCWSIIFAGILVAFGSSESLQYHIISDSSYNTVEFCMYLGNTVDVKSRLKHIWSTLFFLILYPFYHHPKCSNITKSNAMAKERRCGFSVLMKGMHFLTINCIFQLYLLALYH